MIALTMVNNKNEKIIKQAELSAQEKLKEVIVNASLTASNSPERNGEEMAAFLNGIEGIWRDEYYNELEKMIDRIDDLVVKFMVLKELRERFEKAKLTVPDWIKQKIDNPFKEIELVITWSNVEALEKEFNEFKQKMTENQFEGKKLYSRIKEIMQLIITHFYKNKSFLTELSNRLSKPDQTFTKETIAIIWSIYEVNDIVNLLLNIEDDKRTMILGQLGNIHRTDILIYVIYYYYYTIKEKEKNDTKKIFYAVEDDQIKELLKDRSINKDGCAIDTDECIKLMKMLKESSVGLDKIARMLVGIESKDSTYNLITLMGIHTGYGYVGDVLLSIKDKDRESGKNGKNGNSRDDKDIEFKKMICKIKESDMILITKILFGIKDVDKLREFIYRMPKEIEGQKVMKKLEEISIDDVNDGYGNPWCIGYEMIAGLCVFFNPYVIGEMIPDMNEDEIITVLNKIKMISIEDLDMLVSCIYDKVNKMNVLLNNVKKMNVLLNKVNIDDMIIDALMSKSIEEQKKILGNVKNEQLRKKIIDAIKDKEANKNAYEEQQKLLNKNKREQKMNMINVSIITTVVVMMIVEVLMSVISVISALMNGNKCSD
ncbi:hypothetical protein CWI42_051260 [Ordospora colligata]|nr:hypothetical protein CWI42_051260 [Ordospora colligata]